MPVDILSPAGRLARADAVLVDFDGPICSVFAGYPAEKVAWGLHQELRDAGVLLGGELAVTEDPHGLLAGLAEALREQGVPDHRVRELTDWLHTRLAEAEREAVASAAETPGSGEALAGIRRSGRGLAVVSNNATAAVDEYLLRRARVAALSQEQEQGPEQGRVRVFGRPSEPARMKPAPYLLLRALDALGVAADRAVMVGDTAADAAAAVAAGVDFVGFAGGSGRRRKRLVAAGVAGERVVDSWSELRVSSLLS